MFIKREQKKRADLCENWMGIWSVKVQRPAITCLHGFVFFSLKTNLSFESWTFFAIIIIIIMDAQTRFSSKWAQSAAIFTNIHAHVLQAYNKHTHTYRTRTHKQTRGVKAGRFATRKLKLKSFCIWNNFCGLHPLLFWRGRGNRSTRRKPPTISP